MASVRACVVALACFACAPREPADREPAPTSSASAQTPSSSAGTAVVNERSSGDPRGLVDAIGRTIAPTPGMLEPVEADALLPEHRGRRVKVHGFVRDGSIGRRPATGGHRFAIGGDPPLVVEYEGVLPDRFQDRLEVIVTGTLAEDGRTLAGDELVAKCPTSYDELSAR